MKSRLTALAGLLLIATAAAHATPVADAGRLLERGNYRAAVERLRAAMPFAREQVEARFLYATALAGAGERADAIKAFEQLIADHPSRPEPYNNLAALYAAQGQLEKAKEVLERAMRTDPSYAAVYDNLSAVYVEMARASYVKALRVNEPPHAPSLQVLHALNAPDEEAALGREVVAATEAPASAPAPESKAPVVVASVPAAPVTPPVEAKPVAEPAPVVVPSPAAPPASSGAGAQQVILTTLEEWAKAWSARDVEAYLGFYAADFNPVGSQTREQWVAERRERLGKAQSIAVQLESPQVQMVNPRRAIVTLIQSYTAANYSDRTRKQFTLVKVGERWLIRNEKGLGVVR